MGIEGRFAVAAAPSVPIVFFDHAPPISRAYSAYSEISIQLSTRCAAVRQDSA
jgi:hypothetical protein